MFFAAKVDLSSLAIFYGFGVLTSVGTPWILKRSVAGLHCSPRD